MGRGVVAVAVLPLLFCRCCVVWRCVAVVSSLSSLCLSLPCRCCLAFFLIAVMLNLFQHIVVYNIQVSALEAALLFSLQKSKQKAMAQVPTKILFFVI